MPFIAGELGLLNEKTKKASEKFNTMLHGMTTSIKNYDCASAAGLKDRGDNLHFDSASARELGKRYAEKMRALQAPKIIQRKGHVAKDVAFQPFTDLT